MNRAQGKLPAIIRTLLPSTTNEDSMFEFRRSFMSKIVNGWWVICEHFKVDDDDEILAK